MKILIAGAGGHGQVVADILLSRIKAGDKTIQSVGFLDDDAALHQKQVLGLPVLGAVKDCSRFPHNAVIMGIGNNPVRTALFEKLKGEGELFISAIHPTATLGSGVNIGQGTVICAGVVVNVGAVIGHNVILNTGCTVDHHSRLAHHVHIAPGAHLGGNVFVGEGALVGIGATVLPQGQVGAFSTVGAGAVVTTAVPSHTTVVGVPAQIIKRNLPTL